MPLPLKNISLKVFHNLWCLKLWFYFEICENIRKTHKSWLWQKPKRWLPYTTTVYIRSRFYKPQSFLHYVLSNCVIKSGIKTKKKTLTGDADRKVLNASLNFQVALCLFPESQFPNRRYPKDVVPNITYIDRVPYFH